MPRANPWWKSLWEYTVGGVILLVLMGTLALMVMAALVAAPFAIMWEKRPWKS